MRDRQHRNINFRIFFQSCDRQRPEMRWRPDEYNQKQQQRAAGNLIGHSSPTQNRWRRTGRPTDHNVLRCGTFEPDRVDHGITDQREKGQYGRQCIDQKPQNQHRNDAENRCKRQRCLHRQLALWQRTAASSHHEDIGAMVEYVVKDGCGGRGHADTQCAVNERLNARPARNG